MLLNILADEVHRAHQRCLQTTGCNPNEMKTEFMFEAGATAMKLLKVCGLFRHKIVTLIENWVASITVCS